MSKALVDIAAERARQILIEGWTPEHDDGATDGSLAKAAACYATHVDGVRAASVPLNWPWSRDWWKPKSTRQNLIRAAALIVAEIDRLDRLQSLTVNDSYFGFPMDPDGHVVGDLPPSIAVLVAKGDEILSYMFDDLGCEVHCVRGDDQDLIDEESGEVIAEAFRKWEPIPPSGEGWKLAWRSFDEDGPNVCFWRTRPISSLTQDTKS